MGLKNYLIEGITCTGKSSVCKELKKRGYTAINGDTKLAYQGDPKTGEPTDGYFHEHHIWDVKKVECLLNNKEEAIFFCGGSRNFEHFIDRFDEVFVLDIDRKTLEKRLDARTKGQWGSRKEQRKLVLQLHETKEDIPVNGIIINAAEPLSDVVNTILKYA
ncbi:MAG: AAA family ATPase [Hyphomonadaceae bacterium]